MWCLWQSLPCSIQCLSLAITLCFAESDLVAFAPPLGMACVWTWLWQATLPLCRDCLLRRRCGRQAGQCDTPPAFIRRWQLQLCRCRLWSTCVFMVIGASVSTPRRCFISSRRCRGECQRLVCGYGVACRRGLWRRGVLGFTENLDGRRSASAHIAFPDSCHGGGYSPHRSALHPNPRRFYDVDNEPVGRIFQPEPATEPRRDKSVVQFYAFNGASNRLRVAISFYGQCRGGTSDGGFARQASG
jgi:hypothetical protein